MTKIKRAWFDAGWKDFCKVRPDLAAQLPAGPYYVCPLCLRAWNERALQAKLLTVDHVPPRRVGGRAMVLTCRECNSQSGSRLDDHVRREAQLVGFTGGVVKGMPAVVTTKSGRVNAKLHRNGSGYHIEMSNKGFRTSDREGVLNDLNAATAPNGWQGFSIKLQTPRFHRERASVGWLRAAYLAFFAKCGYGFVLRQELDIVRQRIANPESGEPRVFRAVWRECPGPMLVMLNEPEPLRSFAMLYSPWVVFLPRSGDADLYRRLQEQPRGEVLYRGDMLGWPDGPAWRSDQSSVRASRSRTA